MKIICIGRNYALHAAEMKADIPSNPVFFLKPDTALHHDSKWYYPDFSHEIHHEVELVVRISKAGKNIAPEFSKKYYNEIGLGIDFTARDLQSDCKKAGLPWEIAKAFDHSAVVSEKFFQIPDLSLSAIRFSLNVNGQTVQQGNSADMIFSIDYLISWLSRFITLKTGDLLFTGTPEGVGPVRRGDSIKGVMNNHDMFSINIV